MCEAALFDEDTDLVDHVSLVHGGEQEYRNLLDFVGARVTRVWRVQVVQSQIRGASNEVQYLQFFKCFFVLSALYCVRDLHDLKKS